MHKAEFISLNPANGQLIQEYASLTTQQLEQKLTQADKAFRHWRRTSFAERATLLRAIAGVLRLDPHRYASLITTEMGKPIRQSLAEIEKCALVLDYYADNGEQFLAAREIQSDAARTLVRYDALGVLLSIMPWNFPFWQVFRFVAPAIMGGNTVLLKHAPNVPGCAVAIEELFNQAYALSGIFTNLFIGVDDTARVIRDPRVQGVTLTGSDRAGSSVAATAGAAIKKSVLELGGSDPFIVLRDANIVKAAKMAALSRNNNSGQTCISAKRFIVEQPVVEEFTAAYKTELARFKMGDPSDMETDIGPMARGDLRESLHNQVRDSIKEGANLETGGEIPDGPGFFYPVTLINRITPAMRLSREETFGPVASILAVNDADAAIDLANDTRYGLGASLWSADLELAEKLAARIEAGSVFVNDMVKSDPRIPFGGIKQSGYGRELGQEGIREFMNVKSVVIWNP